MGLRRKNTMATVAAIIGWIGDGVDLMMAGIIMAIGTQQP